MKRLVGRELLKTDLVIAREETTLGFLRELGIPESRIHFAADLAFLFEPVSKERASEVAAAIGLERGERSLVGVAPSSEIYRYCFPEVSEAQCKYDDYVKLMAEVTDFVVERFDADVVFVPHFVFPNEFIKNDKIACQDIFNRVVNKERVKLLIGDYRADEVKGVIGLCDLVLSCRMHAAIASTSLGVPTVALSFGHKFHSVLGKMLGQDKCIVKSDADYAAVLAGLKETVVYAWDNRVSIRAELSNRRVIVKEQALSSFVKIRELLYSGSSGKMES
jgi:polysaccharide pyruvyl transferase WcaK-like protein